MPRIKYQGLKWPALGAAGGIAIVAFVVGAAAL